MDKVTIRELILYLDQYKPGWRNSGIYKVSPLKLSYQKKLLNNQTIHEELLWAKLSNRQLDVTFTRQKVIIGYIVDFYSVKYKLAIEVDGGLHNTDYDRIRDNALNNVGVYVLRFRNDEVTNHIDDVVTRIRLQTIQSKLLYEKRLLAKKSKAISKRRSGNRK